MAGYHHHEALHALAVHPGIDSAARSLHITTSALGKRLKALERETGMTLFHRYTSAGERTLTHEGRKLAVISARIVRAVRAANTEFDGAVARLSTPG